MKRSQDNFLDIIIENVDELKLTNEDWVYIFRQREQWWNSRLAQLEQLCMLDPLTGLFNIKFMNYVLKQTIEKSLRYGTVFSIIVLDIDDFKKINDTYGHLAGNDILCAFATKLKESVRASDTLIRYGGDEFIIIAPECDTSAAQGLIERIERVFHENELNCSSCSFKISASIGIASYPKNGVSENELLHHADMTMLRNKRNKR